MTGTDIICVGCPKGCRIKITSQDNNIESITGYDCPQGKKYAIEEFKNPTRILPTTVKVKGGELPLVSVKTEFPISRDLLLPAMKEIAAIEVKAPVEIGDVIIKDLLNTGINIIATNNVNKEKNRKRCNLA